VCPKPTLACPICETVTSARATSPLTSPNRPRDLPIMAALCTFPIGGNRPCSGGRLHDEHLAGVQSMMSPRAYSPPLLVLSHHGPRLDKLDDLAQPRSIWLSCTRVLYAAALANGRRADTFAAVHSHALCLLKQAPEPPCIVKLTPSLPDNKLLQSPQLFCSLPSPVTCSAPL
jgi:hypothetical protein